MDEQDLIKSIRAALERDPAVNMHEYPIEVRDEDGVVVLTGTTENIAARRTAAQIAEQVAGGVPVRDRMAIRTGSGRSDDALREACVNALTEEPSLREQHIGPAPMEVVDAPAGWIAVTAEGQGVILTGSVPSLSHRRLAEVTVWWVSGCADVDNQLEVAPHQDDSDDEIADTLRLVLEKDPRLDPVTVRFLVRDRRVILTGAVPTESARRVAVCDAWYVAGVEAVEDRIEVRSDAVRT